MDAFETLTLGLPGGATQTFTLSKASITLGRATTNDIVLPDTLVSRCHVRIERRPDGCELIDLGSANGVKVNGARVPRALLRSGDLVTLGDSTLRYQSGTREPEPEVTRLQTQADMDAAVMASSSLPVQLVETSLPRIAVHTKTRTWEAVFSSDSLKIGRQPGNDIVLDDPAVSRQHAVFERRGENFFLRDLNSGNGTWLRGQQISTSPIGDGDTVTIGPAQLLFKRGFGGDDLTAFEPRGSHAARRPVVFVPGFGGSMLWRGSEQVWPSPRMVLTQPDLLRFEQPLQARGLVNEVVIIPNLIKQEQYSTLTDYLKESLHYESGDDLLEFGYDFRQDNRVSARQLAAAVDAWSARGPITLIAHSMGCLVARYYIEKLGGGRRVERLICLGGPHAGTPYAFASLLHGPNMLPLGLLNARLRDVLATYPSWYQILPTYGFVSDQRSAFTVLTDESWLAEAQRPLLRAAQEFRTELGVRSSVPSVCVFGYGIKTITQAAVVRDAGGLCKEATLVATPNGDGMIPETSAIMPGSEIHPVKQYHGALYGDKDVKMRLKLELTRNALTG